VGRCYSKAEPGIRRFLQTVGASGRSDCPTPDWLMAIVSRLGITDWGADDFWVRRLAVKLEHLQPDSHVVVSDCRHENEVGFVRQNRFALFGICCSDDTRGSRLTARGESLDAVAESHVSERLTAQLLTIVGADHIIWNDTVAPPDERYILSTVFLDNVAKCMRHRV
jgi:hypothetical protein